MDIPEIAYEHYFKVPVYRCPEFLIRFEEHIEGTFVHCDVYRWTKDTKIKLKEAWDIVSKSHGGPIHALHDINDRKHEKFLKIFGFRRLQPLPNNQELWIWSNYG